MRFLRIPTVLAALVFCGAIRASSTQAPLELSECRLESAVANGAVAARCGGYVVRENRDDPTSRTLRIHVAVIPALRLQPKEDALFILSGGPGQAASDLYLSIAPAFSRIRRDRDIVLVDQRGTGRSHRLDCELPDETQLSVENETQLRAGVHECLRRLPGDPRYYTSSIAVRDLEEIRAALGYETISLYGASYGTRVAQHYMRRYPTRVRSAVLDGVVPADLPLGPDVALAAQRALDAIFARCAADEPCNTAFPQIAQRFRELQRTLREEPASVTIADPLTGARADAALGETEFVAAVRLLTYVDETASLLPLLIHEAQGERPEALASHFLMIRDLFRRQLAQGMHFAVVCSEDAPRWPSDHASDEAAADTYLGVGFMRVMRTICAEWPRGPVDADFGARFESDIPTLILSGGADPATPARYGELVLPGLRRGRHLVLDGQGHGQIAIGCVPRLAARFVDAASTQALDDACVQQAAPAPFMLSLTAPAP